MKHFVTKYDCELPILLCQVVLEFVLEVLKKSGKSLEFYFTCTVLTLNSIPLALALSFTFKSKRMTVS